MPDIIQSLIPLFKVHSPPNIGAALQTVFDGGTISEGAQADEFERQFSLFAGNPYTSLVNSCTSALTLALRMCGVGPGDTVISTPMTCMATNEPIHTAGAGIAWADIEPFTGNIDPHDVRKLLKEHVNVKAIMGVHWAGQPFDYHSFREISREFGIPIIADAAHALGATVDGVPVARCGDFVCFSFQAIKHLTTGDGGAVSCTNKLDHERLKLLRWFGIDRKFPGSKWTQDIKEAGYKFHMNDINACIGLQQMPHIQRIIDAHQENGSFYDSCIDNPCVKRLHRPLGLRSSHWLYSVQVADPQHFIKHMARQGIASDVVHVRNDEYAVFRRYAKRRLPGVEEFASKLVNIPVGWWLSADDRKRVLDAVNAYPAGA